MSMVSGEKTRIETLFDAVAVLADVHVSSLLHRTCTRYDPSCVGLSMYVGNSDQSCTTTLFLKKRYCVPPPTQPPGLVVVVADTVTFSPDTMKLSGTSWVRRRATLKPLSPTVLSHALLGQVAAAGVFRSACAGFCACRAPVILMSSTYHPSSPTVPIQEPYSS